MRNANILPYALDDSYINTSTGATAGHTLTFGRRAGKIAAAR